MPRVEFEGKLHDFPDDASMDEITEEMNKLYGPAATKPEASWGQVARAIPRTAMGGMQEGIGGVMEATGDLVRSESLSEVGAGIAESGRRNVEEATPKEDLPFWKRAVLGGVSSVAQQLPALAGSIVLKTPIPALGSAGLLAGGSTYSETRAAGFGGARSAVHGGVSGVAEVLFEYIPTTMLLKGSGGLGAAEVTKYVLKLFAAELPSELLTTAVDSANRKLSTNPDMTMEQFWDEIANTAGAVMVSTPLLAGSAAGIRRIVPQVGDMQPLSDTISSSEGVLPATSEPGMASQATELGAVFGENTAPRADLPTIPLESAQEEALITAAAAAKNDPAAPTPEEDRRIIDDFLKKQKAPPLPTSAVEWEILTAAPASPVGDVGDLGASRRQAGNAVNYVNPNQGFREDRQFSFGPEESIGLTPRQVKQRPATYGLGIPSDDRPGMYLGPVVETVEQWRKEWLPESTIIVSNEQLDTDAALGNWFSSRPGQHIIVPPVLRSPSKGLGAYNVNTQASAFYTLSHEFGHAFVADKLFEGMEPELVGQIRKQSQSGLIDEATIGGFPEERQALVREYNTLKARVMDGSLTAQEFLDHWIGPAKAGRKTFLSELKVSPAAPAKQLVNALAQRAVEKSNVVTDRTSATLKQQYVEDILSIDEYGAEQVTRFAYTHHWDTKTPLGKLFENILSGLRGFFVQQKKEGVIAPGVEFNKWMEGVGKISRAIEGKKTLAEAKALHKKTPKAAAGAVPSTAITPTIGKSGFNPQDNLFNTPKLKGNRTYAWRAMGAAEFVKLAAGQQEYTGAKAATKGNFLAGIPESAAQFGGKGKYLVEFGKVAIAGDEGLVPGSKANKGNVSNVWQHDGQNWVEMQAPWAPPTTKGKPKIKVKRVQHNVTTDANVDRTRKARGVMVHLIRGGIVERSDPVYEMMDEMIKAHEWDDFNEMYYGLAKKTIKWSLDDSGELKASVDLRRLLDLVGHKMYAGGLGNTILKETLQNSVDATLAELKVQGKGFEPKIDFKVDGSTRTITVTDNGKGMTLQEVATKFLTLAAAGKEAGSAGGFGMAKAAFLFGPRDIALETTRAGVTTKLVASQEDLLGQKDLRKGASSQQTGRPNGTKLTVTLPREYRAESGKMEPVSMPYGLHTGPMIAPVKVTYNGEALPIGRNFPLKNYWKPITVKFDWGTIDLYLESEKADYKTFNVLSQGVPQFQKHESYETKVKLKHNLLIDVKPSVTATHTLYPFNLSREGFKPSIQETDIKALDKYLELIAIKEKTMEAKAAFSRIKQMSLISSDSTAKTRPTGKSFKKNVLDELEAAFAGQTVGITHGDLKVNDKVIFRASEKEKYAGSMKAPEVNFADADLELTEDPSKPLLHNNTNFDPVEWGEKQGLEDAGTLMAKLGTAVVEFRNLIAEAPSLGGHKEDILKGYAGISLDKNYLGVNLNSPYTAMFLNPLTPQFDPRNTAEMVGLFKYALVHEAAHYISRGTNHGDDFVSMEAQLFTEIESLGGLAQFETSLRTIVELHFPTLEALRNEFAKSSTKNLGESIGETLGGTKVRSGDLREDVGDRRGPGGSEALPSGTIDPAILTTGADVTKEEDWKQDKFHAPSFKAWFGDWVRDPEGSSKVRIGILKSDPSGVLVHSNDLVSAPLVLFTTEARLGRGENTFHASTPSGQHYAESKTPGTPDDVSLVPVVLNIRNPFIMGDYYAPAPSRQELQAQGHDGIIYQNDLNGDFSYVVFSPEQIKTVRDRAPHGIKGEWHMDLDFDQSTPEGNALSKLHRGIKNFVADPKRTLRALKNVLPGLTHMMQLQQLSQLNPGLDDLTMLKDLNAESVGYKSTQQHRPNADIDFWKDTNEREFHLLNKLFYKQMEGKVHWLDLVKDVLVLGDRGKKILKENGLDVDASERNAELAKHFENVMNSKLQALNETERVLHGLLSIRFAADQRVFFSAAREVSRKIEPLRQFPFHPQGTFGNYVLVIREKGKVGYPIVWKQAFESAHDRDAAFDRAYSKRSANQIVEKRELSDTEYVLQALPAEFLETVASELDLTDEQTNRLNEIMQPVKDTRLLGKIEQAKLGLVGGGSTDAYRSYADYMWHLTNAQMKLKYRRSFGLAIEGMRAKVVALSRTTDPAYYDLQRILRAMEGVREYVMNPPYEAQTARSLVSIAYLWGSMGTAAINSFGLMTTLSHITSKYGVIGGTAKFGTGVWEAIMSVTSREKLDADIGPHLDRAEKDGTLTQSYAYHLANSAHESRMWKIPGRRPFERAWQKTVDMGMYPFRMVEIGTRRVAFMIAIREHLSDPALGPEEAYKKAVAAVSAQQNTYDRGNRVPFMRGVKGPLGWAMPMATIFLSFPQHMAFHTLFGYEIGQRREVERKIRAGELPESAMPSKMKFLYGHTMRLWAMLFLLAGYEGLPFAENLLDIAEALWKKFGGGKPIRQNLREFIQSLDQDPYLWSRGLGHNVVGFDVSRRVGFGRVMPGTDRLGQSTQGGVVEVVGNLGMDMLGVSGAAIKFMLNMTIGQKSTGEAMRQAPGAMGNFWNAYEWYRYGVRGPHGGVIAFDPESRQPQDVGLIIGKGLGFNPTKVSQEREIRWEQYDRQQFFTTMQTKIKASAWEAEWKGDPEIRKDAREAMREFNARLPDDPDYRRLRLTEADLQRYIREKRRKKREEEANRPPSKRLRGAYEDIRRSWDAPEDTP